MADTDPYDGRKPSFNSKGKVRGYRSKRGAPMYDPNAQASANYRNSLTSNSDWDRAFRDTATNKFGAAGRNKGYTSGFDPIESSPGFDMSSAEPSGTFDISSPEPTGSPYDMAGVDVSKDLDVIPPPPTMDRLANGGVQSHAEMWSAPPKAMRGWDASGKDRGESIFDRYATKDIENRYIPPSRTAGGGDNFKTSMNKRGGKFGWSSAFDT